MTVQTAPEHVRALLTVGEVMEKLNCSESTVRRLIGSGELAAVKIGSARGELVYLLDYAGHGCVGSVERIDGWYACVRPDLTTWSGDSPPPSGRFQ